MRLLILHSLILYSMIVGVLAQPVLSQEAGHEHSMPPQTSMPGMDMSSTPIWLPTPHASSGTGWQPAATPLRLVGLGRGNSHPEPVGLPA